MVDLVLKQLSHLSLFRYFFLKFNGELYVPLINHDNVKDLEKSFVPKYH